MFKNYTQSAILRIVPLAIEQLEPKFESEEFLLFIKAVRSNNEVNMRVKGSRHQLTYQIMNH